MRLERFWRTTVVGTRDVAANGGELRGRFVPEELKAAGRRPDQRDVVTPNALQFDHVSCVTFASSRFRWQGFLAWLG